MGLKWEDVGAFCYDGQGSLGLQYQAPESFTGKALLVETPFGKYIFSVPVTVLREL